MGAQFVSSRSSEIIFEVEIKRKEIFPNQIIDEYFSFL